MRATDRLAPPLDRLAAWHRLGVECLASLRRLARRAPMAAVDGAGREDARAVRLYFDRSIAVHHADLECDLFPALIESMAGSDPVCLREMIAGLTDEHRALASAWRRLRPAVDSLAAGTPAAVDPKQVDALVAQCEGIFRREDGELLPMADRLLDEDTLGRIGAAIHQRHLG